MSTVNGMQRTTQVRGNYAKSVAEKREDVKMTHSSSEPTTRLAHFAKIATGIFVVTRMPSPALIRTTRLALGLTQVQAGELVGCATQVKASGRKDCKTWRAWESGEREMPAAKWELFQIKTKGK